MVHDPQLGAIREAYGRLVYTHKVHEKERERLSGFSIIARWVNIVLSALTFGGIILILGTDDLAWKIASAALAVLTAGFAIFQLSFDPAKSAEAHRTAAKRFLELRNLYELLIADMVSKDTSSQELRHRRDRLSATASEVYRSAPDTSSTAYKRAKKALGVGEEMTFAEKEIDQFLPEALRQKPPRNSAE
ncbi:SLATT domain-containing protein [Leifsonia sp. EB41]|uniref:SLATT domain-containing protein n=1 Tax=Leifsonia sp. EB41 TaxID=3156260 RepID=UPI003517E13F